MTASTYKPRSKGERTRADIVARTATLMNHGGWLAAPVSAVIAATGIQKGGLYRHFDSREALALAAFDHAVGQVRDRLLAAVAGAPHACDQLHAMLAAYGEGGVDVPLPGGCPIMNGAIESDHADPALHARAVAAMQAWRELLVRVVAGGVRRGEVRAEVDPEEFASVFIASVEGAVMLTQLHRDPVHLRATRRMLDEHIEARLRAPSSPEASR